jgi:hypothetical protein
MPASPGWATLTEFRRPAERDELTTIYRRVTPP